MFCVISYLLARLELAIHISKTAFENFRPSAQIEYLSQFDSQFKNEKWIFTETRDYYLNFSHHEKKIKLRELPEKSFN